MKKHLLVNIHKNESDITGALFFLKASLSDIRPDYPAGSLCDDFESSKSG